MSVIIKFFRFSWCRIIFLSGSGSESWFRIRWILSHQRYKYRQNRQKNCQSTTTTTTTFDSPPEKDMDRYKQGLIFYILFSVEEGGEILKYYIKTGGGGYRYHFRCKLYRSTYVSYNLCGLSSYKKCGPGHNI